MITVVIFITLYANVTRRWMDTIDLLLYAAFTILIFFSGANLYNLTFGYQAGFVFGHVGIVFAAFVVAHGINSFKIGKALRGSCLYFIALTIAFMATFAQSNSVFMWPVLFVVSHVGGAPVRATLAVGVVGIAVVAVFFLGFEMNTVMGNTDPTKTWAVAKTYSEYIEQFIGSIVVDDLKFNVWSYMIGLTGVIGAMAAGVALLRHGNAWTRDQLALVAMMGFALVTAWVIACARQGWGGSEGMVVDRYRISSEVFWASAIALLSSAPRRFSFQVAVRVAVCLFMTFTAINVVRNQRAAVQTYVAEGQRWDLAVNALRMGILDHDTLSAIIWFPPPPAPSIEFLRSGQLSVFADGRYKWIGQPADHVFALANDVRCDGRVDAVTALNGEKEAWRLAGRASVDGGRASSNLVVVDKANRVVGFASSVIDARDLWPLLGGRGDGQRRWEGFTRGATGDTQTIYMILPSGKMACKITTVAMAAAEIN